MVTVALSTMAVSVRSDKYDQLEDYFKKANAHYVSFSSYMEAAMALAKELTRDNKGDTDAK